jgi:acetyl esterase/lipase
LPIFGQERPYILVESIIHIYPTNMSYPPAWTKDTDIYAVRSLFVKLAAADTPLPHVLERDHVVKVRDGTEITVRVYHSRNDEESRGGRPVMLVIHGGGFCVGGLESGARLSRFFAERMGGIAVNVEYRLAPEFPFPTAIYDAYDALEWVS